MKIAGAAAVAIAAAIAFPVIFGEPAEFPDRKGGDPWRNAIYDFQTLITGVLAVSAALGTIWQMRASDALQERLHRESRIDARQSALLAMQRLNHYLPKRLRAWARDFREYLDKPTSRSTLSFLDDQGAVAYVQMLEEALNNELVSDCQEHFPPVLADCLFACRQLSSDIVKTYRKPVIGGGFCSDARTRMQAGNLMKSSLKIADMIEQWVDGTDVAK